MVLAETSLRVAFGAQRVRKLSQMPRLARLSAHSFRPVPVNRVPQGERSTPPELPPGAATRLVAAGTRGALTAGRLQPKAAQIWRSQLVYEVKCEGRLRSERDVDRQSGG